jgi:peptide chain release factor subunit 1
MLTWEQLDALQRFEGDGASVLSVYLDLEPARQLERNYRIAFIDLVKAARERLDEAGREALQVEVDRVEAWLAEHDPQGLGLAVFSCTPRAFWQAHFLPVRVADHLAFEPAPDLAPLLAVLDEYERYAVALVDKERARLFTVFMGQIEEHDDFRDFVPGKHEQGGWSQANYQRHHEAHVHRHLKRVADHLARLFRRRRFDRLIVGGPEEATSALRQLLPRPLARAVVATIPAELFASSTEILAKVQEIEQRVEREHEARLVDQLLDAAGVGGRATCGVAATLEALWLGEVQVLVVADGVHLAGGECPQCGRLAPEGTAQCPVCGTTMLMVHDLFERAMARTREQVGRVEVVQGEAAKRLREAGGGMGALLRYSIPAATAPIEQPS